MNFKIIHLLDCLELLGEEDTKNILSTFSSINVEVETFLKNNAISFNKQHQAVTYSAYLIAQFGKNFEFNIINGNELMKSALQTIRSIQYQIGGSVIFLEAEDHEKLLNFYRNANNQYIPFDDRITKDGTKLIQLYRFV